jgi:hypothetical protein
LAGFSLDTAMRRTYMHIARSAPAFRLIGSHASRYLTASSRSRDLLQHTADILCQSVCALRVYSHGLAFRLILFRHCLAGRKLEKCCRGRALVYLQDVMRSEPRPRFNDSPSPNCISPHFPSAFKILGCKSLHTISFQRVSKLIFVMHKLRCSSEAVKKRWFASSVAEMMPEDDEISREPLVS